MRILIADDSPVIRTAVGDLLTEAGYEVVTAADGVEAIQAFYQELPDLVLVDIQMPTMNGYVVCRLIKEDVSTAQTPVLILTAHDTAEDRYWAKKSGADGYLTKADLGSELLGRIKTVEASRALSELSGTLSEPKKLGDADVLAKVAEMLDRKLFEMTIVNDIVTTAARSTDLRTTVGDLMRLLRRFVEYDAGAIVTADEWLFIAGFERPLGRIDVEQFRRLAAGHLEQLSDTPIAPEELTLLRFDQGPVGDGALLENGWPSFFSMPLRSRGRMTGLLVLGSGKPGAFTLEVAKNLRLVEYPIAAAVDAARRQLGVLEGEARASLSSLYSN